MALFRFGSKQTYEEYYVTFSFRNMLGTADITSATVTAIDNDTLADATATVTTVADQVVAEKTVSVKVKAGTSGSDYKITCQILANDGCKYELDAILPVLDV